MACLSNLQLLVHAPSVLFTQTSTKRDEQDGGVMRCLAVILLLLSSSSYSSTHGKSCSTRDSHSSFSHRHSSHGKIKRSRTARAAFMRQHPCPSTGKTHGHCPGYIVDHVCALECGGADNPSNMQWQTVADAKAKDKTERLCR